MPSRGLWSRGESYRLSESSDGDVVEPALAGWVLSDMSRDPSSLSGLRALVEGWAVDTRLLTDYAVLAVLQERLERQLCFLVREPALRGPGSKKPGDEPDEPDEPDATTETHWVEVHVVDDQDEPVANVAYEIKLTDGRVRRGTTNSNGVLRYERIPGGSCELKMIGLDKDAFTKVS